MNEIYNFISNVRKQMMNGSSNSVRPGRILKGNNKSNLYFKKKEKSICSPNNATNIKWIQEESHDIIEFTDKELECKGFIYLTSTYPFQ